MPKTTVSRSLAAEATATVTPARTLGPPHPFFVPPLGYVQNCPNFSLRTAIKVLITSDKTLTLNHSLNRHLSQSLTLALSHTRRSSAVCNRFEAQHPELGRRNLFRAEQHVSLRPGEHAGTGAAPGKTEERSLSSVPTQQGGAAK